MRRLRIAIMGGGRWARIYVRLLLGQADVGRVLVVTPRNADGMRAWAAAGKLDDRLAVTATWPDAGEIDAAIVVNAAADHQAAAERFLQARIPVLIEKPFAMSASEARRLVELAAARGTYLAAAQVFRFAGYLDRFAAVLGEADGVTSIAVTWCDPQTEQRYGDEKRNDPGLPLVIDVLPHVLSILEIVLPGRSVGCRHVVAARAGAQIDLRLAVNGAPCAVHLARDAERRTRIIEVVTQRHRAVLDFTVEPGIITIDGRAQNADPDWASAPSPLTRLLAAFLTAVAGGALDGRLNAAHGIAACVLADAALEPRP